MRIKELETQLGIKLFVCLGRRHTVTEAGKIIDEYAPDHTQLRTFMFQPRQMTTFLMCSSAGDENLVIGTDYGHGDTSSELNAISRFKAMGSLDSQIKRKILSDNPRRFYGI